MMKDFNLVIAGFGGQGILFAGKVVAYAGLINEKEISWLPSYGPEMRGGTANCSVCISDIEIGSPLITNPNILIAMNTPSLDKFIDDVETGGTVIIDSSLIEKKVERDDLNVFYVPATKMAEDLGLNGLANIILIGKLLKETKFVTKEQIHASIEKCVPATKEKMINFNKQAIELGLEN
ncbi:MAG: 2-oxoacid:acceptor oxidoreductase family protein [Clostridia bacterium]